MAISSNPIKDEIESPMYFQEALEDAERLLKYAAEMGIDLDSETRSAVLHARNVFPKSWTEEAAAELLIALTALAAKARPVSAASLKAYNSETRPTMRNYFIAAVILSLVIIPTSIATFVSSNVSEAIRNDITKANALAVKLNAELGPPAPVGVGLSDQVTDLQEYASTVRSIYSRAQKLNHFVFPHVEVPRTLQPPANTTEEERTRYLRDKFELHIPLDDLPNERDNMTRTYQDVRFFAQSIASDVLTFYGAVNSCVLPILYALLGTRAYLLRTFEDQMGNRTFIPTRANSARFLIAAIGGTVIGLFGGVTSQISASPLAIAFLVGYAVEVFFAFLEGLIRSFTKTTPVVLTAGTNRAGRE